jgi:hypothetical protein
MFVERINDGMEKVGAGGNLRQYTCFGYSVADQHKAPASHCHSTE